jgi:murein DD-endopeptidase MepM/ murein hydrolase activator NlpD
MKPHRTLKLRAQGSLMEGEDVTDLQKALNKHLADFAGIHEAEDRLGEDGQYGPATRNAYRWVGWYVTGFLKTTIEAGANVAAQEYIRGMRDLSDNHRSRADQRRKELAAGGNGHAFKPGYPLAIKGVLIGKPGEGTHSKTAPPDNWQSDNAIDIGVPKGTGVYAVVDGKIGPRFGRLPSTDPHMQGIRLYVDGGGNSWYYQHLVSTEQGIGPGVEVQRGQLLGRSGVANGSPHLHLACEKHDPRDIL